MAKLGPNSLTQVFTEIKNWVVSKLSSKANDSDVVHTTGNEIVEGTKTFSSQIKGNISGSSTSCTGNSASATKLAAARTISLTGAVTGSVSFNGSANASISTTLSNIDASKITNGTIDIARIPKAALAELKIVADDDARFALTTADIQNGDTVKVESTGKMYYVKDQTKLSTEDGYAVYTADQASSVDWSGVINKPTTFTPSSHTHGKITNDGKIGTAANKPLITTTGGVVTTGSFGTAANTFCQGNDSRLSDARTPKAHTHAKSDITDFPALATVATSGSYTDLSNKPTIPTVNNATLTIQKNGTTVKTFTANSSANVTANITVPTKTSELTNDSGYITSGNVVDRTSNQSINGEKTFNNGIQTNRSLYTSDNICLRIQNIDNNETNPTQEIGSCAIGFTNKDASAWWAYNRYIRTTADGTAYLNLFCHPIKKSDGSYTVGGYINIYNTGFARVNDPLKMDPNTTWNNNNIVTSNWVRKYFSNSIGDYWSKSATGNQFSRSTFAYLSTIDKATTNTSWSIYRPFKIVDKDNSIELGYVEYGYKSDLAYTRLTSNHNNGGSSDLTIHSNGISYFDNCKELWLVNKNLGSYNTTPSNEIDTQIWFTDTNANKYATLQTDYFANGIRQFALTHKSLRTNNWIGLSIKTSPTDDVIQCQPRFQAIDSIVVHSGTNLHSFTNIYEGWIEMSAPNYCCIDFKHASDQDYLGRIGLNPNNVLYLETINGAPIMANGKNIVRSINGQVADTNGNIAYDIGNDLRTVNVDTAIGSIRLFVYRGSTPLVAMDVTSGGNLSLISIAISAYDNSVETQHGMYAIVTKATMSGTWRNIGPAVDYGKSSLFIKVA